MKTIKFLTVLSLIFFASCTNKHLYFKNGVVVTESRDFLGVYLQVDTTFDGTADMKVQVGGSAMRKHYAKGDSVSIDVRTETSWANPIL